MQDQFQPSRGDFGNFQLNYTLDTSSEFPNLEYIDENYVAVLRFSAPGTSVSVVATATQLEVWRDYFELSAADGGVYIKTLPIMCAIKEDEHLYVSTYDSKLWFRSAAIFIEINLADCLKEFTNYLNNIYCELDELEGAWWS